MTKRKTTDTSPADAGVIAEHEQAIAAGRELDGYAPVSGRVSTSLTFNTSVRFTPGEYERYREAASARDMSLSEFLRAAAAAAVKGETDIEQAALLEDARQKVRDLQQALRA
jgi:hypothetical protein